MSKRITVSTYDGEECQVPISDLSFRVSVYGVVVKGEEILLVTEQNGRHGLPGGGVDLGEPMLEALVREIWEETGLTVAPKEVIHAADNMFWWNENPEREIMAHSVCIYYRCEYEDGDLTDKNHTEWEKENLGPPVWYPINELDKVTWAHTIPLKPIIEKVLTD